MELLAEYGDMLLLSESDLMMAAELIRKGEVIGIPTETVYGLGADALSETAVRKIFEAKGRPADNPLIVHISRLSMLDELCDDIPETAYSLAEAFWPGPLTMVLKKKPCIPDVTSGGLDTVGIRMPASEFTRRLIDEASTPIAAPSANISGYPSPTTARHVCRDMQGRIRAVVDGGECRVGVESTVIAFDNEETVRILRPGFITAEDLAPYVSKVIIDPAITEGVKDDETVRSPGMKYKHYSPKADIIMVTGREFTKFARQLDRDDKTFIVAFDGECEGLSNVIRYGSNDKERARNIFSVLRMLDDIGAAKVYVHSPEKEGIGLAVYNRLIRAAGFEVISL